MRHVLALISAFALSACVEPVSKSPGKPASSDGGTATSLTLENASVELMRLMKKDANWRLVGFDSSGAATSNNLLLPRWPLPAEIHHFRDQKLLLIRFEFNENGANEEQFKVKTDSGLEVFGQCDGLIVFDLREAKSDCFDKNLYSQKMEISYERFFMASDPAVRTIFALRSIKTVGRAEVVERKIGSNEPKTVIDATPEQRSEIVDIGTNWALLLQRRATDEDPTAPASFDFAALSGQEPSHNKLDMQRFLSRNDNCVIHVSGDLKSVLRSCVTGSEPLLDQEICKLRLDDNRESYDHTSPVVASRITKEMISYLNQKGQLLRIQPERNFCGITNLPNKTPIKLASLTDSQVAFTEDEKGFTVVSKLNAIRKDMLSELAIDFLEIRDDTVFFGGLDKDYQVFTGSVKIDSTVKTLVKLPQL